MALGDYYDVYSVRDFAQRVTNIKSSIAELKDGEFFVEAKSKVGSQIEALKTKETDLIKKMQIDGVNTIEDLNRHLANYKQTVLNLSGPALTQAFTGILEAQNDKEFKFFSREVMKIMREELMHGQEINEATMDYLHKQAMALLNAGLAPGRGNTYYRSEQGFLGGQVFPAAFTGAQKKKWKEIIAQRMYAKGIGNGEWDIDVFTSGDSLNANFNWYTTTENLTQTQAKNLTPQKLNAINQEVKKAIMTSTQDGILIGSIIDHILSENQYAFFVGENIKDVTGILGEIQAMYYLCKLFGGENATDLPPNLKWRGGTYAGERSKKPHQDILFETFGIQVKNSTKELVGSVSFAKASIETMLAKTGMSESAKNVFYNFYGTKEFNVPYHMEDGKYVSGINKADKKANQYLESRATLEQCENDIQELLSLFAASFMYMDIAENFSLEDANVLYLVGGVAFRSAANILQEILDGLEKKAHNLTVKSSMTLGKNIIAARNGGLGMGKGYTSEVIQNIKLTSSYNFDSK